MSDSRPPLEHEPVLIAPLLRYLQPKPGDIFLDGTVGLGGHALAILPHILPGGRYIGLDLDASMLEVARQRLSAFPADGVQLEHANYTDFAGVLERLGVAQVDHILLDLGVNSAQLAQAERGFSFDREGPLDMRFDQAQKTRALDLVNTMSERDLSDLFYEFGQEGLSRKIAKRICQVRHDTRITTTGALARAVESVHAAEGVRPGKTHAATRVFQALRVAVNREFDNLKQVLALTPRYLRTGGKLAVIAFHSLEDAIVKDFLRAEKATGALTEITKRPEIADEPERIANPRSRSAKLRVAQRLASAA